MLSGFVLSPGSKLTLGVLPGSFKFWIFWLGQSRPRRAMIIMHVYASIDEHARYALHVLEPCRRWLFFVMHGTWFRDDRQTIARPIFPPISRPQSRFSERPQCSAASRLHSMRFATTVKLTAALDIISRCKILCRDLDDSRSTTCHLGILLSPSGQVGCSQAGKIHDIECY